MARGGLGRGLDSLIPRRGGMEMLAVERIRPNPRQPRRAFDEDSLAELGASMEQVGVLQPVVVRLAEDGFELVLGERRWRAAQRVGLQEIPALIVETDEQGSLERALIENLHRRDLNSIEEASAFRQLIDEAGLTHEALAERVGLSRPSVTNSLRLLDLPPAVQKLVIDGRLDAGHGRALLGLAGHPLMERLAQRAAAEQLSVRATESLVKRHQIEAGGAPSTRRAAPPGLLDLEERLSRRLETRVTVTQSRRRGRITIEFASNEDLSRILKEIGLED